jgi:iron(III) transport system substrate-binding protein
MNSALIEIMWATYGKVRSRLVAVVRVPDILKKTREGRMKRPTRRSVLSALALAGCFAGTAPAAADLKAVEDAARREGELTWYVASLDARNAEAAGRAFTAKYGPKVNVVRAPSQVMFQRLMQDLSQNTANADVFGSVDVGNFVTLKQRGALAAFTPDAAREILPAFQGLDADGTFHATLASVVIIAYNSDKVRAEEAPKSWSDMLDPKWAGKIALGHPAYSGFAGNWAAQMHKLYGKSFFERMEKLKPQVGRSLFDAVNLVASGERLVTASPIAPILETADKGKPLAVAYPSEGSILVATPSAVLKNAPHPNAARLFMEFLCGPEFNEILVRARYESMRADVKPLPGARPVSELKLIRPTLDDTVKGIPDVAELWRDVFGQ